MITDAILLGTVVLAIRTAQAVYIGVDSKVVAITDEVADSDPQQKLHETSGVAFAHAGIFKDANGTFDVATTANRAIAGHTSLTDIADQFEKEIRPQLLSAITTVRLDNPEYFQDKLLNKRPLEFLFASARDGTPRLIVLLFTLVNGANGLDLQVTRLACPGDCQGEDATIGLGEHEVADRFLDEHNEMLRGAEPLNAIKAAIEAQANATPEFVALPPVMLTVRSRK